MKRSAVVAFSGAIVVAAGAAAVVMVGDDYEVPFTTLDGGGGLSLQDEEDANSGYNVAVTFAQPDAQFLAGGGYSLEGGFWPGPEPGNAASYFLDIRAGLCPNLLNRTGQSVIPISVLGALGSDVSIIDPSSIYVSRSDGVGGYVTPYSGPAMPPSVLEDVGTPFDGADADCHGLLGDGYVDLTVHFRSKAVVEGLELADLADGTLVELTVSGTLVDGTPFSSTDWVEIVPPCWWRGALRLAVEVAGAVSDDAWLDVFPLDNALDGGGFGAFDRCYEAGTVVELEAAPEFRGVPFVGFRVNGSMVGLPGPAGVKMMIEVLVTDEAQEITAVYGEGSGPSSGRR